MLRLNALRLSALVSFAFLSLGNEQLESLTSSATGNEPTAAGRKHDPPTQPGLVAPVPHKQLDQKAGNATLHKSKDTAEQPNPPGKNATAVPQNGNATLHEWKDAAEEPNPPGKNTTAAPQTQLHQKAGNATLHEWKDAAEEPNPPGKNTTAAPQTQLHQKAGNATLHELEDAAEEPNPPGKNTSAVPQKQLHQKAGNAPLHNSKDATEEPNPPNFGENVLIVEPGNLPEEMRGRIFDIYNAGHFFANSAQFGERRTAIFLKPGNHSLDIPLPYYFSVYGLGATPWSTTVRPEKDNGLHVDLQGNPNSLQVFWRSIENLQHIHPWMNWWVSQASPLRSVIVDGALQVASGAPASGGSIVNSKINGRIEMGSQQQWYMRSSSMQSYPRAASMGSFTCVGCTDASANDKPFEVTYDWAHQGELWHTGRSYTEPPKVFAEKPFVTFEHGKYYLRVPPVKENRSGPSWDAGKRIPFEQVFVVQQDTSAAQVNAKIASGRHILYPPGIYYLERPIDIIRDSCVVMGLGYATLIPKFGPEPMIRVGNVDDVRIAGFIFQAGPINLNTSAILQWGQDGSAYEGDPRRPGIMYDLTVRVGGPDSEGVGAKYMLQINNGWVLGDNVWLWVADHCLTNKGLCCTTPRHCDTALKVNGSNVHMYGLAAEHADTDIVQWHGEKGRVFFFQSEFPYTPPIEDLRGDWVATPPEKWPNSSAFVLTAKDFRGVGMSTYVSTVWSCYGWRLRMREGFRAFSIEHEHVWKYGMKDISAINFAHGWPLESRLTCGVWDRLEGKCVANLGLEKLYSASSANFTAGEFGFSGRSLCLMLAATASFLALIACHIRRLSMACPDDQDPDPQSFRSFLRLSTVSSDDHDSQRLSTALSGDRDPHNSLVCSLSSQGFPNLVVPSERISWQSSRPHRQESLAE
eukprot:TRINITY_DN4363_c0_g1_i2.p1 TRINITY_DN4363_c0_g1~~TRINITY_DN4363_c0_g1_i2.p1  ORF type:complete len:918 (-),score=111.43 TRINITY_DN4363_c0_g1_i2:42-2795(-)